MPLQAFIEKEGLPPLLEVKLGLYANEVLFNAEEGPGNSMLTDPSGPQTVAAKTAAPAKSRRDVWQVCGG